MEAFNVTKKIIPIEILQMDVWEMKTIYSILFYPTLNECTFVLSNLIFCIYK